MLKALEGKKLLLFDVGWTLLRPASGDWMLTERFFKLTGLTDSRALDPQRLMAAQAQAMDYLGARHRIATEAEEYAQFCVYYRLLTEGLRLRLDETAVNELAWDRTYNMDNYRVFPDAKRVLTALRQKFRLGVISDTWPSITRQLTAVGLIDLFDGFVYSYESGRFKPDPLLYQTALERLHTAAKDAVFLDDSVQNLDGAARLGITPILVCGKPNSESSPLYPAISTLSELL